MNTLADLLVASGWLTEPDDATLSELAESTPFGTDLIPALLKTIESQLAGKRSPRGARSLLSGLKCAQEAGAQFTFGWPGVPDHTWREWLGARWLWWPLGVPPGRRMAWVSSRLGRALDERPDWFAVLRTAAAKFDLQRDLLLTASQTTTARFLERAACLFGLPLLRVHLNESRSCIDWLTRLRRAITRQGLLSPGVVTSPGVVRSPETTTSVTDVFVSPPINGVSALESSERLHQTPTADRVLVLLAEQLVALQVRPRGHLHELLKARLTDARFPTASVWLALGASLTPEDVAEELQSLGAIGWRLIPPELNAAARVSHEVENSRVPRTPPTILSEMPWGDGTYLIHWTRRRDGPWPGQSETEFLDDLLQSRNSASHSAIATLARIVLQRRLIASAAAIRGSFSVVSLSERSLSDLARARAYRHHRQRWDAEPCGLCIRRDWLIHRGARPVQYGDDETWATMPASERPFFQQRQTRSRRGTRLIDWSQEREWRVPGDLDLSAAGTHDVVLFVSTMADAEQLAAISPWPIVVVNSENSSQPAAT
jgi:hypothetical protein